MSASTRNATSPFVRWATIATIAAIAFFASYRYATAATASPQNLVSTAGASAPAASSGTGGCCGGGASGGTGVATGGGGCCGGSVAKGPAVTKSATVASGVQKIAVDVSKGYYDPSTIQLKSGVPAEITFSQASGCTGVVQSQQLGFQEDLTSGPKTVKIAALQPGTYQFSCGMGMVVGTVVVK
jgi:plastocyanin